MRMPPVEVEAAAPRDRGQRTGGLLGESHSQPMLVRDKMLHNWIMVQPLGTWFKQEMPCAGRFDWVDQD